MVVAARVMPHNSLYSHAFINLNVPSNRSVVTFLLQRHRAHLEGLHPGGQPDLLPLQQDRTLGAQLPRGRQRTWTDQCVVLQVQPHRTHLQELPGDLEDLLRLRQERTSEARVRREGRTELGATTHPWHLINVIIEGGI
uniref:IP22037p n=1 Tax=Drosophila melanogaster TaxID=7227 RepID=A8WHH5_DROME|nr:IP22037p [Drosophila melanogaster]